jgi:uncharacterized protein
MRRLIALALLAVSSAVHAVPASPASVETLFVAMRTQAMLDQTFDAMLPMMRQNAMQATKGQLNPEQQRALDESFPRILGVVRQEMSWEKLKPRYVQIYCESFDQEDVDGLIAFYASPAGQAYLNKMPAVMQKSMAMSASIMQSMMPKMIEAMKASIAQPQPQSGR